MTPWILPQAAREITGISKNVEDRKWEPFIKAATKSLRGLWGTEGYDAMIAAIAASFAAPYAAYEALLDDYVKPYLAWRACELSGTRMWAEPDRNGTFTRSGDDYNSVDGKTLAMTKADSRDVAEIYRKEMMDYLDENTDTFAWWKNDACDPKVTYTGGVITRVPRRSITGRHYGLEGGY